MTAFPITVPSSDQLYSLVADLNTMAVDVSNYLASLDASIKNRAPSGGSSNFSSITVSGTGTFSRIAITNPTFVTSYIVNDSINGFGLVNASASFAYRDNLWFSNRNISLPSGTGGSNTAVSYNYLFNSTTPGIATGRLVPIENTVKNLSTNYVSLSVYNTAINKLNTSIASINSEVVKKAYHVTGTNLHKTYESVTADTAIVAKSLYSFNRAADTTTPITLESGISQYVTVPAGETRTFTISYKERASVPVVFAQAYLDGGNVSIICSIRAISRSQVTIAYRNINESASEAAYIQYMIFG